MTYVAETDSENDISDAETDISPSILLPIYEPILIPFIIPQVIRPDDEIEMRLQNRPQDNIELRVEIAAEDDNSFGSGGSDYTSWDEDELLQIEEDIEADLV